MTTVTNDLNKFEIGDVVHCLINGIGRVISTNDEYEHNPISVQFTGRSCVYYNEDGVPEGYKFRTLFFSIPEVVGQIKKTAKPLFEVGDWVLIYVNQGVMPKVVVVEKITPDSGYHRYEYIAYNDDRIWFQDRYLPKTAPEVALYKINKNGTVTKMELYKG